MLADLDESVAALVGFEAGSVAGNLGRIQAEFAAQLLPPTAVGLGGRVERCARGLGRCPGAGDGLGISAFGPLLQILDVPRVGEWHAIGIPLGPVLHLGARNQGDCCPTLIEGEQNPWSARTVRIRAKFSEVAHLTVSTQKVKSRTHRGQRGWIVAA